MSASRILQHLYSLDTSSTDISRLTHDLIRHDEEEKYLSSLQGSELAQLIDFLDEVRTPLSAPHIVTKRILQALSTICTTGDVSRRCLRKLQSICSGSMTLPSSYTVSGDLTKIGDEPAAYGGFADVWEGTHCDTKVCIKALRVTLNDDPALAKVRTSTPFFVSTEEHLWALQSFFKEVIIWKRLRHPNIVSFIGVTTKPLQMVSEWMPNGTLTKYVENNPSANRIGLVSGSSGIVLG